jgi:methyl-accepting chemotaxis protein
MAFWRRKQVIIERGLQLRFARFVILYMTLSCFITAFIVFYATFTVLSEKLVGIYPQNQLPEIFHRAYWAFFVGLLIVMPILFYGAVLFSHRIAGPLPKIYEALKELGQGNFDTRLTLRKSDELLDLAEHINQMALKLKERELKR